MPDKKFIGPEYGRKQNLLFLFFRRCFWLCHADYILNTNIAASRFSELPPFVPVIFWNIFSSSFQVLGESGFCRRYGIFNHSINSTMSIARWCPLPVFSPVLAAWAIGFFTFAFLGTRYRCQLLLFRNPASTTTSAMLSRNSIIVSSRSGSMSDVIFSKRCSGLFQIAKPDLSTSG